MNRRVTVWFVGALAALLAVGCGPLPGSGGPSPNITLGADCTMTPNVVAGASLAGCNLSALGITDLSGLDLTGIDLRGANLTGINLTGANLTDAQMQSANLTGANLSGANLTNANLSGALLFGALLIGAILFHTELWDAPRPIIGGTGGGGTRAPSDGVGAGSQAWNDRGEPWCGPSYGPQSGNRSVRTDAQTSFKGAVFTGTEIRGLDLRVGDFEDATFDFRESPWYGCLSMAGGRFHNATFIQFAMQHWDNTNADFSNTTWIAASMCQSEFGASDLSDSKFIGSSRFNSCADYSGDGWPYLPRYGLSFNGANLQGARFGGEDAIAEQFLSWGPPYYVGFAQNDPLAPSGVDFRNADLTGAVFESGDFSYANFQGATTTGISTVGGPFGSGWVETDFGSGGWSGSTWSGIHNFTDAICPDGSAGSGSNPCFESI